MKFATRKKASRELRVRMYRVGFGDFFLFTVPSSSGPKHILIDCGVTNGKTGKGDIGTIKEAVAHMATETDHKLALIIVTHRHMDHIIGFSRCAEEFKKFQVEEIWMPFWETEYDPEVSKLQLEMTSMALDAQNSLALAADTLPGKDEMLAILENATGKVLEMTAGKGKGKGGGTNAASLALLKAGLGVKPKYYHSGQKPELPDSLVKAGLTAEILGPPPKDALAFMKLTDLKKGVGQYLQAAAAAGAADSSRNRKGLQPFAPDWQASAADYPSSAFREFGPRGAGAAAGKAPSELLEKAVLDAQPAALMTAMKQLDSFLNNQSLVVLFGFKGKKLLFAGDAQAGNWENWLYDGRTPTTTPDEKLGKNATEVLGTIDFYKVGHHGSTNATPIVAVENMNAGFTAMCSTQGDSFGSVANKSEVPRGPLMDALAKKSALVRSDQIEVTIDKNKVPRAKGTKPTLPKPKAGKFSVGSVFVDYLL